MTSFTSISLFTRLTLALCCVFIVSIQVVDAKNNTFSNYGPRSFPDTEKWTAIVAAYEPEIKAIKAAFEAAEDVHINETVSIKGVKYQLGTYKGEPVIIFTTGISVPNAAMTMQMALDYFPIDTVIMMGIAGAINPEFEPGDIAIPERWYFHDESVYVNPDETGSKYILPVYYEQALARYKAREKADPHAPKYQNFGIIHPEEMSIVKDGWDSPRQMPYFEVTPRLLSLAEKASTTIEPITLPSGKAINIALGGNGVTGSVFADNAEYRVWLQEVYSAQVTEMESAAVGQVCFVNEVDWIIIRSVSDLAGGQEGQNDENVFDAIASGTGTKMMMGLLDQLVVASMANLKDH
ncbi:purine phosphorylase [Ningiella sp. W23]|uniref:5'-methylthioadenosine/S-adenosylhomocysteine nucleosidase family protein n=1 Tax=Ningiella sp. W23 TaxID=3023715 RepID=UPI003756C97A